MIKLFVLTLLIPYVFTSCLNNQNEIKKNKAKDKAVDFYTKKTTDNFKIADYFKIVGDSVLVLPFEIEVDLSPKAEEKITKGKETIIVSVFLTGTPRDSSHAKFQEDGSFFVATSEKEISYGQVARFDNIKFPIAIYDQISDKDIDLDVKVFCDRKSSKDNLLNCEPLFDKISKAANKRFTLKGELIYGDD